LKKLRSGEKRRSDRWRRSSTNSCARSTMVRRFSFHVVPFLFVRVVMLFFLPPLVFSERRRERGRDGKRDRERDIEGDRGRERERERERERRRSGEGEKQLQPHFSDFSDKRNGSRRRSRV